MRSPYFALGLSFIGKYTSCTLTQVLHALGGFPLVFGDVVAVFQGLLHRTRGVPAH
jgi:hypothetical protein